MNLKIIVMAKVPTAGTVKTRLQPFLTTEQCGELAECFLLDTVNKIKNPAHELVVAYSPSEKRDDLTEILGNKYLFVEQKGDNLGEKMFNAFEFVFSQNADSVVMIGTDSPTFPVKFITQAFENLQIADVILGETEDGGFYLIGLRILRKEIFENVEWSSTQTFAQTIKNIESIGLKVAFLPVWYDVDFPADIEKLQDNLNHSPAIAPRTFEWLKKRL